MLLVIEEVQHQLGKVNTEVSELQQNFFDKILKKEKVYREPHKIDSELSTYTDRQRRNKQEKYKSVCEDYQENKVIPGQLASLKGGDAGPFKGDNIDN